jgi:hypothetical protein
LIDCLRNRSGSRAATDPGADKGSIGWTDLARVLGRPAPFWPGRLLHPELILEWQPGDGPVHHAGVLGKVS